jgi:hypothetical protein
MRTDYSRIYPVFCRRNRPTACILVGGMTSWMLPGFSCRDLIAILVKYLEGETERRVVTYSAYLPYDSEDPPPTGELEELMIL